MLPKISPQVLFGAVVCGLQTTGIAVRAEEAGHKSPDIAKNTAKNYPGLMTYQTMKNHLDHLNVPKTSELSSQPLMAKKILQNLSDAPDQTLFSRIKKDKYFYSSAMSALTFEKPFDKNVQPSFVSLCLNAFYLHLKTGIEIYIPNLHQFDKNDTKNFHECIQTIAQNLLAKLEEKESVAIIMPSENAVYSEYAHVSTLIFQREGDAISCIVYDSMMTVREPTVDLLKAIAKDRNIEQLDVFVADGISQADNHSCRTKSLVESSVALRDPNPMKNIGDYEEFSDLWRDQNDHIIDLEDNNNKVMVRKFHRNTYPDKTSQLSRYHDLHPNVINNPIGFNKKKSLQEHVKQYTHTIFLSSKPIENGVSVQPGGISLDKSMNIYLKLKGLQINSRAKSIVDSIKKEHGDQYKEYLNKIIRYHSLETTSENSWDEAESQLNDPAKKSPEKAED